MKNSCIILLFLSAFACSTKEKSHSDFITKLDSLYSNTFPVGEPGAALLIMKGDSILFAKGYGVADMFTKEVITTKTLFNLGSISKTFVSNGILLLQEQGKLSVEDSLYKYFPDFRNKKMHSV